MNSPPPHKLHYFRRWQRAHLLRLWVRTCGTAAGVPGTRAQPFTLLRVKARGLTMAYKELPSPGHLPHPGPPPSPALIHTLFQLQLVFPVKTRHTLFSGCLHCLFALKSYSPLLSLHPLPSPKGHFVKVVCAQHPFSCTVTRADCLCYFLRMWSLPQQNCIFLTHCNPIPSQGQYLPRGRHRTGIY